MIATFETTAEWLLQQGGLGVGIVIIFIMLRREDTTRKALAGDLVAEREATKLVREQAEEEVRLEREAHQATRNRLAEVERQCADALARLDENRRR